MNKTQALQETIALWEQLRRTGGYRKECVPGPHQKYKNTCPCCEYTKNMEMLCFHCPIKWSRRKGICYCTTDGSPFLKWGRVTSVDEHKMYAGQIVRKARKALEAIK